MAEIKRLWAFGDSFTYTFELREGHPYYEYKPEDGKRYVDWLGEYYNAEVVNLATPGWGNMNILYDLLRYADKFSDQDIIIVGASDSGRIQSFEYHKGNESFMQASYSHYIDEQDTKNSIDSIDPNFPQSLINYILSCKYPLINHHTRLEMLMIINVLKLCKGSKKVLWSVRQWGDYETIDQHTNGKIPDMHWSWNGHKYFSHYLRDKIDSTDFFIDEYANDILEKYKYIDDPLFYERIIPKL